MHSFTKVESKKYKKYFRQVNVSDKTLGSHKQRILQGTVTVISSGPTHNWSGISDSQGYQYPLKLLMIKFETGF